MFALKAILMLIFPFYRVNVPINIYPENLMYVEYSHGVVVGEMDIAYGDELYVALRDQLKKESGGWRYDMTTYAPQRLFSSEKLKINCIGKVVVINYEQDGGWVQISKVVQSPCPAP
jgi:hypothetical protein